MVIVVGIPDPRRRLADQAVAHRSSSTTSSTPVGVRFPFDIPVEDFLFGFALVTAVLLLWERQRPAAPMRGTASERRPMGLPSRCPRRLRRRRRRLRPAGRREPRIPRASANLGAAHANSRRRPRTAPARRRLRDRRLDGRVARSGARSRDHRRRRLGGDAGRGGRAKPWPDSVRFVHSPIEAWPTPVCTVRSTASSPPICCATWPTPTLSCGRFRSSCDPAGRWRCTSIRSPIRRRRRGLERGVLGHHHSVWAGGRPATPPCTDTCGAACKPSTVPRFQQSAGTQRVSPGCTARRCRAGSATSCTPSWRTHRDDRTDTATHAEHPSRRAGRPTPTTLPRAHTSSSSAPASPDWLRRPDSPNAASPSTSWNDSSIWAAASVAGPTSSTTERRSR